MPGVRIRALALTALSAGLVGASTLAAGSAQACVASEPSCQEYLAPGAIAPPPADPVAEAEFAARLHRREERGAKAAPYRSGWRILLVPALRAGWAGWCLVVKGIDAVPSRCPVDPSASRPVAWEGWEADPAGTRGFVLTSRKVKVVAADEGSETAFTEAVPGLGGALSAAAFALAAPYPSMWSDEFEPVQQGHLEAGGRDFAGPPYSPTVAYPAEGWAAPHPSPEGVCRLSAGRVPGLRARAGDVLETLTATPGVAGVGLLSCVNTRFALGGSRLEAAVLLNAARPGAAAPPPLPGAARVRDHRGLFSAPGRSGTILARRAGPAWLLVEGGTLAAREHLLVHLRALVLGAA